MVALFIAGWSEADSIKRAGVHVIGVLLVSLNVGTDFSANMLDKIQVFSSEEVTWRERVLEAPSLWGKALSQKTELNTSRMRINRGMRLKGREL